MYQIQLENGENEDLEIQVTPDFIESNLTRDVRDSGFRININ